MISVVDLLLQAEQFNGHFQTELTQINHEDLLPIMAELESRFDGKLCTLRLHTDGGGSIYIDNFWEKGENGEHTDRLILGINTIVF